MADVHYEVDEANKPGRDLMDAMRDIARAWDKLARVRGILIQSRTGDGTQASHYDQVAERYGYSGTDASAQQANAKASFEEIDGNWSTVNDKIQQMVNRHL